MGKWYKTKNGRLLYKTKNSRLLLRKKVSHKILTLINEQNRLKQQNKLLLIKNAYKRLKIYRSLKILATQKRNIKQWLIKLKQFQVYLNYFNNVNIISWFEWNDVRKKLKKHKKLLLFIIFLIINAYKRVRIYFSFKILATQKRNIKQQWLIKLKQFQRYINYFNNVAIISSSVSNDVYEKLNKHKKLLLFKKNRNYHITDITKIKEKKTCNGQ